MQGTPPNEAAMLFLKVDSFMPSIVSLASSQIISLFLNTPTPTDSLARTNQHVFPASVSHFYMIQDHISSFSKDVIKKNVSQVGDRDNCEPESKHTHT